MLLIVFVALIANSALLSDAFDVVPPKLDDFDWNKFADNKPWYILLHDSDVFQNNLDCPTVTVEPPVGAVSKVTTFAFDKVSQTPFLTAGTATKWDSTGYFEVNHEVPSWTGRYNVIAVVYDRYIIFKYSPFDSNDVTVYVAFRNIDPDVDTMAQVLVQLQDNNIDIEQLQEVTTDHCQ